jgi:short-subunit dehydrogenase
MSQLRIDGKTVLLTGATGGLGRAIAAELAGAGGKLVLSSRKGPELDELAAGLPGSGHTTAVAELSDPAGVPPLLEQAGEVDILVANAGIGGGSALEQNDAEMISTINRVNLEIPMLLAAGLRRQMLDRGSGHMVFISSLAAKAIPGGTAIYAATKAGLRAFSLGLRADIGHRGIGVSVVMPGFVRDAGMFHDSGAKAPAAVGTTTPEAVAAGVASAIAGNRAEVDVAPLQQRAFVDFSFHFHGLGKALERRMAGGSNLGERLEKSRAEQTSSNGDKD